MQSLNPIKRFAWREHYGLLLFCGSVSLCVACELAPPPLNDLAHDYGLSRHAEATGDVAGEVTNEVAGEVAGEVTGGAGSISWPNMRGIWQIEHLTTLRSELPVILEEVETKIEATMIAEVTQEGSQLWLHHRICDVTMSNTPAYNQTILPDSFIDALPLKTRRARLIRAELENREVEYHFEALLWHDLRGVRLVDPQSDSLPRDATDPRIYDQDLDGAPGLSASLVGFPSGEVSLIQNSFDEWHGQLTIDYSSPNAPYVNTVKGVIDWGEEQRIIEASEEVLLIEVRRWIPAETTPEPSLHVFSMERVTERGCPERREPPRPSQ